MATDFRLGRLTLGSVAAFCIGDFMEQLVILPPGKGAAISAEIPTEPGQVYWFGLYVAEGDVPKGIALELQTKTPGAWKTVALVKNQYLGLSGYRVGGGSVYRVTRPAMRDPVGVYLQIVAV